MRKIIGIVLVLAAAAITAGIALFLSPTAQIAIIGGADGPTSIYVGRKPASFLLAGAVVAIAAIALAVALLWKRKRP